MARGPRLTQGGRQTLRSSSELHVCHGTRTSAHMHEIKKTQLLHVNYYYYFLKKFKTYLQFWGQLRVTVCQSRSSTQPHI